MRATLSSPLKLDKDLDVLDLIKARNGVKSSKQTRFAENFAHQGKFRLPLRGFRAKSDVSEQPKSDPANGITRECRLRTTTFWLESI